jgi:hypothetical protein
LSICSHLNSVNGLAWRIPRLNRRLRLEMGLPLNKAPQNNARRLTRLRLTRLRPRPRRLTATLPTPQDLWREGGGRGVFQRAG